ncbi:hypothetical protein C8R45DRAFT_1090663 [Mycena sanguinolenta]|nr:hypothetical protein C8R45DRAFT_1090663 [Mycena sanguinolenta]
MGALHESGEKWLTSAFFLPLILALLSHSFAPQGLAFFPGHLRICCLPSRQCLTITLFESLLLINLSQFRCSSGVSFNLLSESGLISTALRATSSRSQPPPPDPTRDKRFFNDKCCYSVNRRRLGPPWAFLLQAPRPPHSSARSLQPSFLFGLFPAFLLVARSRSDLASQARRSRPYIDASLLTLPSRPPSGSESGPSAWID